MVEVIKTLFPTKKLKFNRLQKPSGAHVFYDNDCDALVIQMVPPKTETIVHYIDDENVALVYEADSKEVVGIQVEGFTRSFLPKHANVESVWRHTVQIKDFGDLIVKFKKMEPLVAKEVMRASHTAIEQKNVDLAEILNKNFAESDFLV